MERSSRSICYALRVARLLTFLSMWSAPFLKRLGNFFGSKLSAKFSNVPSAHLARNSSTLCQLQHPTSQRCIRCSPCSTGRAQRSTEFSSIYSSASWKMSRQFLLSPLHSHAVTKILHSTFTSTLLLLPRAFFVRSTYRTKV